MITTQENRQSYLSNKVRSEEQTGIVRFYATEFIEKDELVFMLGGEVVKEEEFNLLTAQQQKNALQVDENLFLVPRSSDSAFLPNHNCDPNLGIKGQSAFVALRDIEAGEELTFDRAMAFTKIKEMPCSCGSVSCRSRITGEDHSNLDLRRKYGGHFSQYLEKKHSSIIDDRAFLTQFNATGAWGIVTALDLHDCNPETIRSADKIREFTYELCDRIKVNRFGEPVIVHFGEEDRVAGYSLVQLIETSLVSGHFANLTNRVYLDIFSCAFYSPSEAAEYARSFFEAKRFNVKTYLRH